MVPSDCVSGDTRDATCTVRATVMLPLRAGKVAVNDVSITTSTLNHNRAPYIVDKTHVGLPRLQWTCMGY